jgi:hypothetical protein
VVGKCGHSLFFFNQGPGMSTKLILFFVAWWLETVSAGAAEPVKLRTLAGQTREGELLKVTDQEIVFKEKGNSVTTPIAEVLDLDLRGVSSTLSDSKYTDMELTDGSLLHAGTFGVKGKNCEVKLLGGQEIKIPLEAVSWILNDAQDAKGREEWQNQLRKKGNTDLVALTSAEGKINYVRGTFGEGDEEGKTISFESSSGAKRPLSLSRIHAMSFVRKPGAERPAALCKVHDTARNVLVAAKVALDDSGFQVTTVSGIKVLLTRPQAARLDYSQGKLTYLSDLEPVKVVETSNVDRIDHFRRDKNLDGGPLRVGKEVFSKGLALHAYTELVYDIGGQFEEFKTVLGVDPQVGGEGRVKIVIEGDGRELFAGQIQRTDERRPLVLPVKNVKQLRIVVSSAGLLDLGSHVNLADAKVSK